jgi:hypothetical protein
VLIFSLVIAIPWSARSGFGPWGEASKRKAGLFFWGPHLEPTGTSAKSLVTASF